jgi:hypothetical protein
MGVASRLSRTLLACAGISIAAISLGGCATAYVDGALKDANLSEVRKPARATDAQLLFTFQTKGTANAKATEALKGDVTKLVQESGLFATVGSEPALSGSIISITLNNVPITDQGDAAAKGFATGLTFGLVGSAVTDGYVCVVEYVPAGGRAKVSKTTRHAIHTTMGAKGAPENAVKAKNIEDAVRTMTRQVVTEALKEVSRDPSLDAQQATS